MKKSELPEWAKEAGIDRKQLKEIFTLEVEAPDETGSFFLLPDKRKVYISQLDMILVNQMRKLPASTRIHIVALTERELEDYLKAVRSVERHNLIEILKKTWYWRETGDQAIIESGMIPYTDLSQEALLKKLKRRNAIARDQMVKIMDWFEGDRREVYCKE